jgi:outer membrane protein OmpA-like peptidoglycan-associated protein
MKSIIFKFFVVCFFCGTSAYGQTPSSIPSQKSSDSEISFHVGGGLSTFNYRLSQGKLSRGLGGGLGVDYAYFINEHFGIGTGAGISLYNASVRLDGVQSWIPGLVDEDGDEYELFTSFIDYIEQQRAIFLRIPVMLQFRTGGRHSFYAQAGAALHIPVNSRYEANDASLLNEAYYLFYDVSISSPSFMGLGNFPGRNAGNKLSFNPVITGSAEIGIRWQLNNPEWALYTGAYVDYGLNDALKGTRNQEILQQNAVAPDEFTTNSVLSSRHSPQSSFVGKVSLMTIGLKVRIAFGMSSFDKRRQTKETEITIEAQRQREIDEAKQQVIAEAVQQAKVEAEQQLSAEIQEIKNLMRKIDTVYSTIFEDGLNTAERNIIMERIYFDYAKHSIRREDKSILDKKAEILKDNPKLRLRILGNTCDISSDKTNIPLGLNRANTAKQYLMEKGVEAYRIVVATQASNDPIAPNDSEDHRKINRRCDFEIVAF